jgi:hypothetical protein
LTTGSRSLHNPTVDYIFKKYFRSYWSTSRNVIFIIIELKSIQDDVGIVEITVGSDLLGLCN